MCLASRGAVLGAGTKTTGDPVGSPVAHSIHAKDISQHPPRIQHSQSRDHQPLHRRIPRRNRALESPHRPRGCLPVFPLFLVENSEFVDEVIGVSFINKTAI